MVQTWADFLGLLLHRSEMNLLRVYIGTPAEVRQLCGAGTLACYFGGRHQLMVVNGDDTSAEGDFTIAHEYGHHVANNRRNPPWSAFRWGTKRWATYEVVCPRQRARQLFPGAQEGWRYWRNPGEGFAEAYAFLNYAHVPTSREWAPYYEGLRPNRESLGRILTDVRQPWTTPTVRDFDGRIGPREGFERTHVRTPLDGRLGAALLSPKGADFDLYLLKANRNKVLRRSTTTRRIDALQYTVCGQAAFRVEVIAHRGSGRFFSDISRP